MHASERALLANAARATAREAWAAVAKGNISATWAEQVPRLLSYLTAAQFAAADSADMYVHAALAEQGMATRAAARVQPMAFAGIAADGRPLETLLALPAIEAKMAIARGAPVTRAMATGRALVELAAHTQVADTGRTADQVAIVARTGGYVRMVVGKTCSRCLILAGRWYKWNAGFARHPKCDCIGIPSSESLAGDLTTDTGAAFRAMAKPEQDRVFGKDGAQAIRDGADAAKVVNARRGMVTADGRLYTTEAAGRRPRLMPEQIYREASGDRTEAVRLLKLHGYLI